MRRLWWPVMTAVSYVRTRGYIGPFRAQEDLRRQKA